METMRPVHDEPKQSTGLAVAGAAVSVSYDYFFSYACPAMREVWPGDD